MFGKDQIPLPAPRLLGSSSRRFAAADFPPLNSLDALPNHPPRQVTSFVGRCGKYTRPRQRYVSAATYHQIGILHDAPTTIAAYNEPVVTRSA